MLDRYEFWHAAAAVLIVLLIQREPALWARLGPRGFALLLAGALLPLGDYLGGALFAPDWIDFLIRPRWLHGVASGALAIGAAALLAAFLAGSRRALAGAGTVGAGWALHLTLDALTPAGIRLGASEQSLRADWPAFAEGHLPLVALLVLALAALRIWPARARALRLGSWALAGLYLAGGVLQLAFAGAGGAALAAPGEAWDVVPGNAWRSSWRVVLSGGGAHRVGELGPFGGVRSEPSPVPRWNDEPRLLAALADPVVRRFYFQVFRHPVTHVDETPLQLTLTMREAADLDTGAPGATFIFETDLDGRERVYHVERFD